MCGHRRSGRLIPAAIELLQGRHRRFPGNTETAVEIRPEAHAIFRAGLGTTGKRIAAEPPVQCTPAVFIRFDTAGLEVGVEIQDRRSYVLLRSAVRAGERVPRVHQPLRVYSAQGMAADIELSGTVA